MSVIVDPQTASTLPPRKRAKTQEEKEQRRIERILRNRRAAHASREKKRRHVEFLENHVMDMDSVMNVYKDRDSQYNLIVNEMLTILKENKLEDEVANFSKKITELPMIPSLKMNTASLLESNKRSSKKQKATPKPRPITLKKEAMDEDVGSSEEEDEEEDEDEDGEEEMIPVDKEDNSMMETKIKVENDFLKNDVYLSPPISNVDSTSPSNLSLELNSKMSDYYSSNPLFDDLDRQTDDFFSTNLQIKHEDEEDISMLSNDVLFNNLQQQLEQQQVQQEQQLEQQQEEKSQSKQQETNQIQSGFKMMHHPAAPFNSTHNNNSFELEDFVLVDD